MRVTFARRKSWLLAGSLGLAGLLLLAGLLAGRGLGPGVALAAGDTSDGAAGGTISVSGQATIKAVPDTARVSLGVVAQATTAAAAMDQCSAAMTRITNSVVSLGVPRANVQTSNISLYPQYKYDENGSSGTIVGYQASNEITCTWTRLDKVGDLIDAAVKAGANSVNGVGFSLADSRDLELEAIGAAVRDAKSKADALAAAAGVRVGAVKSMSLDSYVSGPIIMRDAVMGAGMNVPVEPGTVEMQVNVRVEYGIE